MKKLLSLILSITMLTSVAQLSAFADITAPVGTTEDNPVSAEASLQDETEDVAEVTEDEPVLHSTLEQESAKLIALTAEETGFKLTDNSVEQANSNSDVQANTTAEQSETEPVTSQATEPDNTTKQPAGVTKVNGNMLKAATSTDDYYGQDVFDDTLAQNPAFAYRFDKDRSCIMPGIQNTLTATYDGGDTPRAEVDCSLMIPQAICTAGRDDEYLLVSAYCGHQQSEDQTAGYLHQSVVYVLTNPATGSPQYLNTLVINARVHVGGIAYDKNTGYLWYGYSYSDSKTTNSSSRNKGTIRVIDFDSYIEDINDSTNLRVTTTNLNGKNIGLSGTKTDFIIDIQPDCMTFYDGQLWVGEFIYNESTTIKDTYIYSYNPADLRPSNLNSINNHTSSITLSNCNRLQGFEFVKQSNGQTCLFASRSYSRKISKTYISQIDVYKGSGTSYTRTSTIPMPSMVEGVEYTNGRLYTMFESSSQKFAKGYNADGTQDTTNVCKDVCNRIAALDITDDLNYDRVLDIGGISGIENVILDQNSSVTDTTNSITLCRNGQWIDTNNGNLKKDSGDTYVFESKVPSGKKWLVRANGNLQLVSDVSSSNSSIAQTFNPSAASCSGFYIEDNATLEIKNVASDESIFERKDYLDTIISVEKGGTLKIYNKETNGDIVFDGKNKGVSDAVIRTVSSGSNISVWDIDNVTFRNILDTTSTEVCGVHPYGKFSQLKITNCNFQNIKVLKWTGTTGQNREDAAIFFPRSYIGENTLIQNCTFDNSAVTSVTNPVDFEAIRFQGTDANFTLDNVSFNNYKTGGYGPVGFVNYNRIVGTTAYEHASYYDNTFGETGKIGNLTLNKVTMTNCKGTSNSLKAIKDMSGSNTNHYYAPLTFSKKITGTLTIKDSKFSNCEGYCAGAIAFDLSDSGYADINKVLITGTTLEKDSDGNVVYDTDTEGNPTAPNADYIPAYFYQCQGNKNGGAIGVYGKITTFDIDKVLIDECKSTNGSAIMLQQACNIGTMSLTNSLVQKCLSQNYIGTGFNTDSNFSGTIRTQGAATCGSFIVDNCDIINNKVWNDGGGIYWNIMSDDAHMYMTNSTISGNYAAQSGGGIYCEGIMTVRNSEIINNSAGNDGGGICQGVYSNSNTKGDNPIYPTVDLTKRTTNLSLESGVKVDNNFAKGCGGGVAFILRESDNITDGSTFTLKLTMADSNSDGSTFTTPAQINNNVSGELGGGVYYGTGSEGSTLDVAAGTKGNAYNKTVDLMKGTIKNNQARRKGGGIYVMGNNTTVNVTNIDVTENKAGYDSCSDKSYITFTNPDVSGVTTYSMSSYTPDSKYEGTEYQGGGIAIRGAKSGIIVTGGSVSNNKSAVGGGIDARSGAYVTVNGGSVSNNTAGIFSDTTCNAYKNQNGGGIYTLGSGSAVNVSDGTVSGNNCYYRGGGIYSGEGSTITMTGGKISDNTSDNDGGGIGTLKGSVEVTGGNIENNIAKSGGGGAVIALGGTVTVTGGLIRYNEANGNNTDTAYHKTGGFGGIGGGICISGRDGKQASFTLSGDNIGIYGNNAEFAADDVYASGDNTQLTVPKVDKMNLKDYKGIVTGWFEDYNNNDTSYSSGTNLSSEHTGSRYNSAKGSVYAAKYEITDGSDSSVDMIDGFVNVANNYVCMTLGTLANARISNNVYTADGKSLNGTDNTEFSYTLTSDSTLTSDVLTYEIGGFTVTPTSEDIKNNTFTFTLKGGETISFPNLSENLGLTVTQTTRSVPEPNKLIKTESGFNSGDFVKDRYEYSFTTDPSNEQSLVYNNYIDRYITVTLNYYNRAVVNGSPATMESDATSVDIPVKLVSKYISDGKIDTAQIIIDAAVVADSKYKFDNVIEGYCVWGSQKEASTTGIASYYNFHTGKNYESSVYHTDCYGKSLNEPKDSDKWVTYNNNTLEENEAGTLDDTSDLSTINVWLFNYPKTYNVTYYSAPDSFSTIAEGDTFVYTDVENESFLSGIYYNQRLGSEDDAEEGSAIDTLTGHLTGYKLPSVSGKIVTTASEITVSGTPYYFKGWATDKEGKVIVSTDIRYRYRVTNDITLYPVYSKYKANVGLTATAINPDIYIDSDNNARTRLNTMLNPYGCPDYDTNIKKVAIVYVTDANGKLVTNKAAKVQAAVQKSLAKNDSKSENSGASFADKPLTVDGDIVEGTETTEKVTIGNANYFVHLVSSDDVTLTSKNRVQFTTTFKTDQLKNKTLAAFVAMKYNEEWKVSDNYINYIFDENGEMTSSASVVI
ncbi:MAG: hypothetical protein ACI4HN_02405 [Ruminococcus sp.]